MDRTNWNDDRLSREFTRLDQRIDTEADRREQHDDEQQVDIDRNRTLVTSALVALVMTLVTMLGGAVFVIAQQGPA